MKKNNVIFSTSLSYMESVLFDPFNQAVANDMREATLVDAIEQWRHDEKMNFNSVQHLAPAYYLVVYDIGRWNGRYKAFSVLSSLSELLELDSRVNGDCEFSLFLKGNSVQGCLIHHDGRNYFKVYRILLNPSSKWNGHDDFLKDALDGNYLSDSRIRRYCRSVAPVIRRVYEL